MLNIIFSALLQRQTLTPDSEVQLSYYEYIPKSQRDNRKIIKVKINEIYHNMKKYIEKLSQNEEIAIDSIVVYEGKNYHIPMVDFKTDNIELVIESMNTLRQQLVLGDFILLKSGRSFHGYFLSLINSEEWLKFNGYLLLENDSVEVVDQRWIGHRLISGYSSLRITKNTKNYFFEPTIIYSSFDIKHTSPEPIVSL